MLKLRRNRGEHGWGPGLRRGEASAPAKFASSTGSVSGGNEVANDNLHCAAALGGAGWRGQDARGAGRVAGRVQ